MRLADGLGVKPVRMAGPPRVPSVTRRLGPRFGGAADGCCATDDETRANGSPTTAAATRPLPVLRNRLRVNIPVSSFARPSRHRLYWPMPTSRRAAHRRGPVQARRRKLPATCGIKRTLTASGANHAMSSSSIARVTVRQRRIRAGWNAVLRILDGWRQRAGWPLEKLAAAPKAVRIVVAVTMVLAVVTVANLVYQVARKPTEMLFPVSGALTRRRRTLGGSTDRSSARIPPAGSRPSCWRRWRRWRAPAIRWRAPIGAGGSR